MKILFIGDTVGKAGRTIVHQHLKHLQEEYQVDLQFSIARMRLRVLA